MFFLGCEPISIPEEPKEYNAPVDIVALIVPDTIQAGKDYTIQYSFLHQCGQTSIILNRTESAKKITLRPLVHVDSRLGCPGANVFDVITDSLHASIDSITLIGRNVTLTKIVHSDSSFITSDKYSIQVRFLSVHTASVKPYQLSTFSILDRLPVFSTEIIADSIAIWDTTFVDTLAKINYSIAGIPFRASVGIKQNGFVLLP